MRGVMKWVLGVVVVAGVGGLLVWAFTMGRAELSGEAKRDAPIKTPMHLHKTPDGELAVTLAPDVQKRFGFTTVTLAPATFRPHPVAYGELTIDPLRRFTLRAPIAGVIHGGTGQPWPDVGSDLPDGTVLGSIQPLLGPVTRVDLATRLATAQGQVREHRARLAAARASYEHKQALNAEGGVVSDRAVEEAKALLQTEQARLDAAELSTRLIQAALAPTSQPASDIALTLTQGGQVVAVSARPGESVQQGEPIITLARFDRLLARVELPAGQRLDQLPTGARVVVLGSEGHPLRGESLGPIAGTMPGQAFLLAVSPEGSPLRPGAAVMAYLDLPGEALAGVIVPGAAVVRSEGRAWVFVQVDSEQFVRRAITPDRSANGGWFVSAGVAPGERVVVIGAQSLLSEILKSEIRIGEEQK